MAYDLDRHIELWCDVCLSSSDGIRPNGPGVDSVWSAMTSGVSESAVSWVRLTDSLDKLMHELALVTLAHPDDRSNQTLPSQPLSSLQSTIPPSAASRSPTTSTLTRTRTRHLSPDDRLFLLDVIQRQDKGRTDGAIVTIEGYKVFLTLTSLFCCLCRKKKSKNVHDKMRLKYQYDVSQILTLTKHHFHARTHQH